MTNTDGNLKYRVDQLESGMKELKSDMKKLLTNHLPHIQQEMVTVKTEARVWACINAGAIIIGIIVSKMFF